MSPTTPARHPTAITPAGSTGAGRRAPVRLFAALAAAVTLALAGCSGGGPSGPAGSGDRQGDQAKTSPVVITPADGASGARPDKGVTVTVKSGKVQRVRVEDSAGRTVAGAVGSDGVWRTRWALRPRTRYEVDVRALDGDGEPVTASSRFTTLTPRRTVETGAAPLDGETVGVGMPIVVYFSRPVTDRAAAERALEVRTSTPIEGAWHWMNPKEVDFRPRHLWEAGTKVTLHAHIAGVRTAPGVYGSTDQIVRFTIGPRHVTEVDASTYRMVVHDGDQVARRIRVSLGKKGHETSSGTHIVQEKRAKMIMDSSTYGVPRDSPEGYRLSTNWNVRLTNGGEFVHSAPWSVGDQGRANVSHGCVNAAPAEARWFFQFSRRGDIVKVTGTSRRLTNRDTAYTPWVYSWSSWLAGSATGEVITGR